nr:MAG TPA: hypothetical protein [Caudoviricetes sp.]
MYFFAYSNIFFIFAVLNTDKVILIPKSAVNAQQYWWAFFMPHFVHHNYRRLPFPVNFCSLE